jgi:dihydroorotate dehydrogenase
MNRLSHASFPLLRSLDPETAHRLTILALKWGVYPRKAGADDPRLAVDVLGLHFPNPLGLAAGFDKNGEAADAMLAMGFGFTEVGTVTPLAQAGNPRPRLFRLPGDRAVINRMGFNNDGHGAVRARLIRRRDRPGIVGVNIGANKDSDDRIGDYVLGLKAFHPLASYFTINISSPNTPGLRALQEGGELEELLHRIEEQRRQLENVARRRKPVLLKISPDLDDEQLDHMADTCLRSRIDGVIIANTTLDRALVMGLHAKEAGGLSGRPLFARSTRMLARFRTLTHGRLPLIGVGGVGSAEDAYAKIRAGAHLVQLYTALTFEGPDLIARIKDGLVALLERDGHATIVDAVGTGARDFM